MRAIFSIGASVPGFQRNQFGGALGGPIQKDKTFVFGNYEGFRQHLHQTGVDLVPDTNARNGYLPCKLVTPGAESVPGVGTGVRRRLAADQRVAGADPRRARFRRNLRKRSTIRCKPSATTSGPCGWITFSREKDSLSAIYTIDDSADFTPTSTNATAPTSRACASRWPAWRKRTCFRRRC